MVLKMTCFPEIPGHRKCNFLNQKTSTKIVIFFFLLIYEKIAFFTVNIFALGIDDQNCISHNNAWSKVDTAQKRLNLSFILRQFSLSLEFCQPILNRIFWNMMQKQTDWHFKSKYFIYTKKNISNCWNMALNLSLKRLLGQYPIPGK